MPWIIPIQDTLLKLRPIDSKQLEANEIRQRNAGDRLGVVSVRKADNNHWQIRMAGDLTIGGTKTRECFIWPGHWDGAAKALLETIEAGRQQAIKLNPGVVNRSPDGTVKIPVAYKSQMDNSNNPSGSCNVTSAAICLEYYGIQSPDDRQLEDVLYEWLQANGLSRHDPIHLKQAIEHFGCRDDFTTRATVPEIKAAIDNGKPVIVHGYFTSFGHIVVLVGYNATGFIVHDPYGEWHSWGYDRNDSTNQTKGEAVVYSYGLIERTCLPDGGCWAHFITRPGAQNLNYGNSRNSTKTGSPRYYKPQEFRPNSIAARFIGHFEGLKLRQYYCQGNVSTIGIGTTRWHDGKPIPVGATITEEQAIAFFRRDAAQYMTEIQRLVDVPLTARQIAVCLSFVYNVGAQAFAGSTLLKVINADGSIEQIRAQLRRWINADGKPSDGLRRRRNAEAMLWQGRDDWESAGFD